MGVWDGVTVEVSGDTEDVSEGVIWVAVTLALDCGEAVTG
jgi:hypothetical protein